VSKVKPRSHTELYKGDPRLEFFALLTLIPYWFSVGVFLMLRLRYDDGITVCGSLLLENPILKLLVQNRNHQHSTIWGGRLKLYYIFAVS
jgi:hypothetical protein